MSATGGGYGGEDEEVTDTVTVTVLDENQPALVVNPGSLSVDEAGGGRRPIRCRWPPAPRTATSRSSRRVRTRRWRRCRPPA